MQEVEVPDTIPNDEITPAVMKRTGPLRLRDKHSETVKRTRPEGCTCGYKVGRAPLLDDYDNR